MGLLNKFRKEGKKKNLEQEIADHLSSLFNTKQSYGAWQKGLGMRSYSSGKTRTDIIEEVIADIKYNIETYEKRIKIIEIEVVENDDIFNLRFQIKCKLGSTFHSYYIGFKQAAVPIQVEVKT